MKVRFIHDKFSITKPPWSRFQKALPPMITGHQIKAARALLGLTMKELSEISGVSQPTIQRMEKHAGEPKTLAETIRKVGVSLEERGIVFVEGGAILKTEGGKQ